MSKIATAGQWKNYRFAQEALVTASIGAARSVAASAHNHAQPRFDEDDVANRFSSGVHAVHYSPDGSPVHTSL
jgi:hypothetical protein